MCECDRCKKEYEEYDLLWVEQPSEYSSRIIWTGRGRGPGKEKKMELVCDTCIKKETTSSSLSS
jgi:hypothetical protein